MIIQENHRSHSTISHKRDSKLSDYSTFSFNNPLLSKLASKPQHPNDTSLQRNDVYIPRQHRQQFPPITRNSTIEPHIIDYADTSSWQKNVIEPKSIKQRKIDSKYHEESDLKHIPSYLINPRIAHRTVDPSDYFDYYTQIPPAESAGPKRDPDSQRIITQIYEKLNELEHVSQQRAVSLSRQKKNNFQPTKKKEYSGVRPMPRWGPNGEYIFQSS